MASTGQLSARVNSLDKPFGHDVQPPDETITLIGRCIEQHEDAWSAFVAKYAGIAASILYSRFSTVLPHEKDDIIQNVFAKLLNGGLRNFRGTTTFEFLRYFSTIVRNEAITFLTSDKYKHKTDSFDDSKEETICLPAETARPDRLLERREMLGLIGSALQEYPLEDRQLFLLKLKGHKDKEVAAILGTPLGTVASKYSRMIEKMKKALWE